MGNKKLERLEKERKEIQKEIRNLSSTTIIEKKVVPNVLSDTTPALHPFQGARFLMFEFIEK